MMSESSCKIWLHFTQEQIFGKASKSTIEKTLPTYPTAPYKI
jgi:hypothetical protein